MPRSPLPNDPRFAISKRYEPIRFCVFCTQFFDQFETFGLYVYCTILPWS